VIIERRNFLAAAAALAVGFGIFSQQAAAAQDAADPKAVVESFYAALDEAMQQGEQLGFDGRYEKLAPVVRQMFDVPVMAKIAVGNEWKNWAADKKTAVLEVFDRYMVTTYAARFKKPGPKFTVGEVTDPAEGRKRVATKLTRSNGEVVSLDYLFRQGADKSWKAIDVYYTGAISEMARMRSDFAAMVQQGPDALIAALEQKIADLKAEKTPS
jgi:phospholipid transport system substrate-binding protein